MGHFKWNAPSIVSKGDTLYVIYSLASLLLKWRMCLIFFFVRVSEHGDWRFYWSLERGTRKAALWVYCGCVLSFIVSVWSKPAGATGAARPVSSAGGKEGYGDHGDRTRMLQPYDICLSCEWRCQAVGGGGDDSTCSCCHWHNKAEAASPRPICYSYVRSDHQKRTFVLQSLPIATILASLHRLSLHLLKSTLLTVYQNMYLRIVYMHNPKRHGGLVA